MCCCRVDTSVLLANLFAKLKRETEISEKTVQNYLDYLTEVIPTYVSSDFSRHALLCCVEEYPELYKIRESSEETLISAGELRPNLEFFNSKYSEPVARFIERLADSFVKKYYSAQI